MYYGHQDQPGTSLQMQPPPYVPGQSNYFQDPVAQAQTEPARLWFHMHNQQATWQLRLVHVYIGYNSIKSIKKERF